MLILVVVGYAFIEIGLRVSFLGFLGALGNAETLFLFPFFGSKGVNAANSRKKEFRGHQDLLQESGEPTPGAGVQVCSCAPVPLLLPFFDERKCL